jgi:hypothetical protein
LDGLEGHNERATKIWGALTALGLHHKTFPSEKEEQANQLRTALGNAAFDRAYAKGTLLSLNEAITLATTPYPIIKKTLKNAVARH